MKDLNGDDNNYPFNVNLNAIMIISVMSDGSVAQFGQPYSLLTEEEGGILSDLVTETGPASSQRLRDIAREAFRSVSSEAEERTKE